eukprot:1015383-Prorocentrum_minimum.AAC.2
MCSARLKGHKLEARARLKRGRAYLDLELPGDGLLLGQFLLQLFDPLWHRHRQLHRGHVLLQLPNRREIGGPPKGIFLRATTGRCRDSGTDSIAARAATSRRVFRGVFWVACDLR